MNLHINKDKFDFLMSTKIVGKFVIGSHLYKTNDEYSDTDYLIIYYPFKNQLLSAFTNHHQFQYKDTENNIDYNFVDIITFVRNLIKGDSTINYELLYSEEFKQSKLGFLCNYIEEFRTYTIIKAYLGFADRDLRLLKQRKNDKDRLAGLFHAQRSYIMAQDIVDRNVNIDFKSLKDIVDISWSREASQMRDTYKLYREYITKEFQDGNLTRYLKANIQKEIDEKLFYVLNNNTNNDYIDLTDVYQSNEDVELKYN